MRLISSTIALRVSIALASANELTLSEVARATGAGPSAVQRALSLLVADKIVDRVAGTRPRYRLRSSERAALVVDLALSELSFLQAVKVAARANHSIEFVARDHDTLVVVFATATAVAQAPAARLIERLAAHEHLRVDYLDHDDVRRDL